MQAPDACDCNSVLLIETLAESFCETAIRDAEVLRSSHSRDHAHADTGGSISALHGQRV